MDKKIIVLILGVVFGIISIGLIMVKGEPKNRVNLSSISEIGEGALYSTEQAFRTIAPISEDEEMLQGDRLHKRRFSAFGKSSKESEEWEKYIGEVGKRLAANVKRKGIQYKFHIIERSNPYAFSGPGGHIYITTGLLKALKSEAELAGILAHEIVHVDAKHCAGRLLRQGTGRAYDLLIGPGYSEAQETEADVGGVYLAAEAGYHPMAVIEAFKRIDTTYKENDDNNSITPVGDTLGAVRGMIGRYFKSHPEAIERIDKIRKYISDNKIAGPTSRFYVGQRNYKERVSCTTKKYKEEFKKDYVVTEVVRPDTEKPVNTVSKQLHKPLSYTVGSEEAIEALANQDKTIKKKLEEINQDPKNIVQRLGLAQWYVVWGMRKEALAQYQECIRIDPSYASLYRGAALIKVCLEDYSGALIDLEKAAEIEPSNSSMHEQLGDAYLMNKKFQLAINEYERAKTLGVDDLLALERKIEKVKQFLSSNKKSSATLSVSKLVLTEGMVTGYDFIIKD